MMVTGGDTLDAKEQSRNIPEKIKREVRQRCGFGCVICGLPIYDYEHMKEWAKVKEHIAEDITLLCPEHHREKTAGRLPVEIVKEANRTPYNHQHSHSKSMQLYYKGDSCIFMIGSNNFSVESDKKSPSILIPLMVDGFPVLSFVIKDKQLLLNANVFDKKNNLILK